MNSPEDFSADYNKELLQETYIDVENLEENLVRVGLDVHPGYRANYIAPFVRQLERDGKFTGRVAGTYFFWGTPVTESEYRTLSDVREDSYSDITKDVLRRRVITSSRDLARSGVGSRGQLRNHLERVIQTQEVFSQFAQEARQAFENPEEYDDVERPDDDEIDERIRSLLEDRLEDLTDD